MNKSKKVTLTLLGIAASVGLGSLIASSCRQEPQEDPLFTWCPPRRVDTAATPAPSPRPDPFVGGCNWGMSIKVATPTPKKPLKEGYERIKCDKCGEVYDRSTLVCSFTATDEERRHFHSTPESRAQFKSWMATRKANHDPNH